MTELGFKPQTMPDLLFLTIFQITTSGLEWLCTNSVVIPALTERSPGVQTSLAGGFGIVSAGRHCAMACLLGSTVRSQTGLIKQIWDH